MLNITGNQRVPGLANRDTISWKKNVTKSMKGNERAHLNDMSGRKGKA